MKSVQELVDSGKGSTYRYRDYYGNRLPYRETVWEVKNKTLYYTLYHYGVALVHWIKCDCDMCKPSGRIAWLSNYSSQNLNDLSVSDKNGIRCVDGLLV